MTVQYTSSFASQKNYNTDFTLVLIDKNKSIKKDTKNRACIAKSCTVYLGQEEIDLFRHKSHSDRQENSSLL